ncbi:hypothetical protein [Streptomyces sp. NPDC014733]|uniref:hypothetical protein n=1 Tax=Streptomyces sp. NPDC014733 TaxID=3364885 RepID=UPI0036FB7372
MDTATCHGTFHTLGWLIPGDATTRASLTTEAAPLPTQALITAVEVQPDTPARAIAVLGDSRVDGIGSTPGTDRRRTDLLAERLHAHGSRTRCVVNQGIGGNLLLSDGIGTAALAPATGHFLPLVSHSPSADPTKTTPVPTPARTLMVPV